MSAIESDNYNDNDSYSDALFLFSNKSKKKIFASVSAGLFFGLPTPDSDDDLSSMISDISKGDELLQMDWQNCTDLEENQTCSFTFNKIGVGSEVITYSINAQCKQSPVISSDSALLFIHARKVITKNSNDLTNDRKDYAEFIDLAAHNLDAPLRKLSVLVDRVVERIGPSSDLQSHIDRIQACLSDMRSMVDSLSIYSGVGLNTGGWEACDLFALCNDVLVELKQEITGKNAAVQIHSLPIINGNKAELKIVLRSLLSNALLFCNPENPPSIEIDAKQLSVEERNRLKLAGNSWFKITVQDHGIGFAQEDAEKIFQPFVRLNGKSAYPGSGMGLAISRKIAESHHGIIYAERQENIGTRFILILPQT